MARPLSRRRFHRSRAQRSSPPARHGPAHHRAVRCSGRRFPARYRSRQASHGRARRPAPDRRRCRSPDQGRSRRPKRVHSRQHRLPCGLPSRGAVVSFLPQAVADRSIRIASRIVKARFSSYMVVFSFKSCFAASFAGIAFLFSKTRHRAERFYFAENFSCKIISLCYDESEKRQRGMSAWTPT